MIRSGWMIRDVLAAKRRSKMRVLTPMIIEDEDIGVEYADCGRWRSYQLSAMGVTLADMLESATISEVDQDGGEIRCYGILDTGGEVYRRALALIEHELRHA